MLPQVKRDQDGSIEDSSERAMSRRAALRRVGGGGATLATAAVLSSRAPAASAQDDAEAKRAAYLELADGIIAALNGDNPDDLDQWVEPDALGHVPLADLGEGKDLQWVKDRLVLAAEAFPNRKISVQGIVIEGNQIAAHGIFGGTHEGSLQALFPTGGDLAVRWLAFVTVGDEKVIEYWYQVDALGALKQFGLFEPGDVTEEAGEGY